MMWGEAGVDPAVLRAPVRVQQQANGRFRFWGSIPELGNWVDDVKYSIATPGTLDRGGPERIIRTRPITFSAASAIVATPMGFGASLHY